LIKTTRRWRDNQKDKLTTEAFVEVSIKLADPKAMESATAEDNNSMPFSNVGQIVDELDKSFKPFTFLEHNQWVLDGSNQFISSWENEGMGYVSEVLCDDETVFDPIPVITIPLDKVYDDLIPGVTITWGEAYGEFASEFIVNVYNGQEQIVSKRVTDNDKVISDVEVDIINYDRFEIIILKWCLPYRRARIQEILLGLGRTYRKEDLLSYSHEMIANPLSSDLPKYSIAYEIDNVDNTFDPNNIQGFAKYLIEQQRVNVRYGYMLNDSIEWISGGIFYLFDWSAPQNGIGARFGARDTLEFMKEPFNKGLYRPDGISLYDLALEVLTDANIPTNPDGEVNWHIHEMLKDVYTTAPLPVKSHASCLQLISIAGCCCLSFDRTGRLWIDPMSITTFLGHAEATDNGSMEFSNTAQIVNGEEKEVAPYATMEQNQWVLDDTVMVFPAMGDTGFISEAMCDENCVFDVPPKITLTFARMHYALLSEITIIWGQAYGEFATDFRITVYSDDNVVTQKSFVNDKVISESDVSVRGYNRIEIEILKWCLPHRRARIEDIPARPDYEINIFNSYSRPEINITKRLSGVDVKTYKYTPENDVREIHKGTLSISGTQTIIFNYPGAVGVSAEVTGGTLISETYYTYTCALTIQADGVVDVAITGLPLVVSSSIHTHLTGEKGEPIEVDNTIITSTEQAEEVALWTKDYLVSRQTVSFAWRADPRADALDAAMFEHRYGIRAARMNRIRYTYSGAFKATGEGRVISE